MLSLAALSLASLAPSFVLPNPLRYLHPKEYASPSGGHVLFVDPSDPYGAGPGIHQMSRDGVVAWSRELPVTLWDAVVTDGGWTVGVAYSRGWASRGTFHVITLSPRGELVLNDVADRACPYFDGTPMPWASAIELDPDSELFLVRVTLYADNRHREEWWTYRLSSESRVAAVVASAPEHPDGEPGYVSAYGVKWLDDVPLKLAAWRCSYRESKELTREGALFTLLDENDRKVWSLPLLDDHRIPDDERAPNRWRNWLREHGVILDVGPEGHFSVWSVRRGAKLDYQVRASADGFEVVSVGESAYRGSPRSRPMREPLPEVALEAVALVDLSFPGSPHALQTLDRVAASRIDSRGRILLIDDGMTHMHAFDGSGRRLFMTRLAESGFHNDYCDIDVAQDGRIFYCSSTGRWRQLDLDGNDFDPAGPYSPDNRTCPDGSYWRALHWTERGNGVRRYAGDELRTEVLRTPDDFWFEMIWDVVADGQKGGAVVSYSVSADERSFGGVAIYDADGEPLANVKGPSGRLAVSQDWIAVGASSVYLIDRSDYTEYRVVLPAVPIEGSVAFSPEGDELWFVSRGPLLHRYALP